jgi:putative phosphoesterase
MNKIAIISDIHGNLPALDAVLLDIKSRGISKIYCLGDLVGYYCFFNEVVERICELKIPTVIGNHDYALINKNGFIERSKTCTKLLKWQLENSQPDTITYLKSLPSSLEIKHGNYTIKMIHAGLEDHIDEYLFDVDDEYLARNNFSADVLISGHTHLISYKKFYSGKLWLNPGSVGQPRDGNNKASYLVLDAELNPTFVRLDYDFMKVVNSMKLYNFEDYISAGLQNGKKI